MSDKIQQIYNRTKFQETSPKDLDDLILRKVRAIESEPEEVWYKKSGMYIPIAASILLVIFFQSNDKAKTNKLPVNIVKSVPEKKPVKPVLNANRNKLPSILLNPQTDITDKIVPACNGTLIEPEEKMDLIERGTDNSTAKKKSSTLPIQPIYSYDKTKPTPECDKVSSQILKPSM